MKIKLNNKIVNIDNSQASLKDVMVENGFVFPCHGKGICGRCIVTSSDLPVTEKDKKFLLDCQLNGGCRLACDKIVRSDIEIFTDMKQAADTSTTIKKIDEGDIIVIIEEKSIVICIVGNSQIVDTRYSDLIIKDYDSVQLSRTLKNVIAKESIEFFEHYGISRADKMLICAKSEYVQLIASKKIDENESYFDGTIFGLPTDQVVLLPHNGICEGDVLIFLTDVNDDALILPNGQLIIDNKVYNIDEWKITKINDILNGRMVNVINNKKIFEKFKENGTNVVFKLVDKKEIALALLTQRKFLPSLIRKLKNLELA